MSKTARRRAAYAAFAERSSHAGHRFRRYRHLRVKAVTFMLLRAYQRLADDDFSSRPSPLITAFERR